MERQVDRNSYLQLVGNKLIDLGNLLLFVVIIGVAMGSPQHMLLMATATGMIGAWGVGVYLMFQHAKT